MDSLFPIAKLVCSEQIPGHRMAAPQPPQEMSVIPPPLVRAETAPRPSPNVPLEAKPFPVQSY